MRSPKKHLDDNTVVDFLDGAVAVEDVHAVAVHLVTCPPCRAMVETCRDVADGGQQILPAPFRRFRRRRESM